MTLFDVITDDGAETAETPDPRPRVSPVLLAVEEQRSPGVLYGTLHPLDDSGGKYQRCGGGRRVIRKPLGGHN